MDDAARKAYQRRWYLAHADLERAKGRDRARAKRAADPEGILAKERAWKAAHPEIVRARWDRWYRANADARRAYMQASKERTNELARVRRLAQPEKARAKGIEDAHRRRARGRSFRVSERDWRRMLDRYLHRCGYCSTKARLTQEHVIPLSRGGRHSIGNLIPACQSCNSSKGGHLLVEWRLQRRVSAAA